MVIAVLNSKGGSGKSTLTTNLARGLQEHGHTVCIVDTDRQGTARDWGSMQEGESDYPSVVAVDRPTLNKNIPVLNDAVDFVVIDGAAKLEDMYASAVKAADAILIPVQPSPPDIWALSELVDLITARREVTNGLPKTAFVISRQVVGSNLAKEIKDALLAYGLQVFKSRTSQRVIYGEAMIGGSTVLDEEPKGKAANEIRSIVKELLRFIDG